MLPKPGGGCGIRRAASPLFFEDAEGFAIFSPSNHLFCLPIPPSPVLPIFISNEEWPNFFMDDTKSQYPKPDPENITISQA